MKSYTFTNDDTLISDVCNANFRSARLGQHDDIDYLYDWCSKNDKLTVYQKGIDASIATFA